MDMSSPRFGDTIEFEPGASARAVIALFWVHAVPLALVLATPLLGPVMAGLALLVGGSWLWLRRHPVCHRPDIGPGTARLHFGA